MWFNIALYTILSQSSDPISGGAGWVGHIIFSTMCLLWQVLPAVYSSLPILAEEDFLSRSGWAGAGLLGLVLSWLLLKHLPDKDKQFSDLIKSCDEQVANIVKDFKETSKERDLVYTEALKVQRQDFDEALRLQRQDFRDALAMVNAQHEQRVVQIVSAIHREISRNELAGQ